MAVAFRARVGDKITGALAVLWLQQLLLLLLALSAGVEGASYTWGQLSSYASPLYETEVRLHAGNRTLDIRYPEVGDTNDYTIIAMHAFDLLHDEEAAVGDGADASAPNAASVVILSGGIGHNYTNVRFHSNPAYLDGIHFRLAVYGVEL